MNDPVVTTHTVGGSLYYHLAEGFSFVLGGDQRIMQVDADAVHLVRSTDRWVRGEQVMMSSFGANVECSGKKRRRVYSRTSAKLICYNF